MREMIFKDWASKYFECGIPVIPLIGKVPISQEYQRWSLRAQTEEELDYLIARYPTCNIGAVTGLWACALDVDTDDEDVLNAIPFSPLKRRGKCGNISLFAPSSLANDPGIKAPVELLNIGRQIVLPPSIHPDTKKPYIWTGLEDIFTFHFKDLPQITRAQIDQVARICIKKNIFRKQKRATTSSGQDEIVFCDEGRNNRLSRIAYAMACDSVPLDEATERLMELDVKEHEQPWFADKKEPHRGVNPRATAERMIKRAITKATAAGDVRPIQTFTFIEKPKNDEPAAPESRGLMKLFQDYCATVSRGDQAVVSLGGAIALMAAITSNRFRTQAGSFTVWPNMYVMNVAASGFGKETPQNLIDELLLNTDLRGSASYKSGSSIIMNLPEQPTRLDVIDECAMLLKAMAAREDYKADIVDVLSMLYSKSNSYFHGFTSKGDGKNFGACWNPCVNILGSTTPAGFKSSVSKDMAAKGLLPRFLVFWQKDVGEFKRAIDLEAAAKTLSELKRYVQKILSYERPEHPDSCQRDLLNPKSESMMRFDPHLIEMSEGAQKAIVDIQERYFYEGKEDPDSFESAFKNRFAQHVCKLSLLDAISQGLGEICTDNVEWAHSVVTWQWNTVKGLYELASAENEHEKMSLRIYNYIKKHGVVKQGDLTFAFRHVQGYIKKDIIQTLLDSEKIEKVQESDNLKLGRKPICFRIKA